MSHRVQISFDAARDTGVISMLDDVFVRDNEDELNGIHCTGDFFQGTTKKHFAAGDIRFKEVIQHHSTSVMPFPKEFVFAKPRIQDEKIDSIKYWGQASPRSPNLLRSLFDPTYQGNPSQWSTDAHGDRLTIFCVLTNTKPEDFDMTSSGKFSRTIQLPSFVEKIHDCFDKTADGVRVKNTTLLIFGDLFDVEQTMTMIKQLPGPAQHTVKCLTAVEAFKMIPDWTLRGHYINLFTPLATFQTEFPAGVVVVHVNLDRQERPKWTIRGQDWFILQFLQEMFMTVGQIRSFKLANRQAARVVVDRVTTGENHGKPTDLKALEVVTVAMTLIVEYRQPMAAEKLLAGCPPKFDKLGYKIDLQPFEVAELGACFVRCTEGLEFQGKVVGCASNAYHVRGLISSAEVDSNIDSLARLSMATLPGSNGRGFQEPLKLPKTNNDIRENAVAMDFCRHWVDVLTGDCSPRPQVLVNSPVDVAVTTRNTAERKNQVVLRNVLNGGDVRTTVMLRNIPNKITQPVLKDIVDRTSFGKFDFMYLRIDFNNQCNVGYAFINFSLPEHIAEFVKAMRGQKWFHSDKVAEVSYATIQGREALIAKFRNSSVMLECALSRPKLYYAQPHGLAGQEEPFPGPDNLLKLARSNQNAAQIGLFAPMRGNHEARGRQVERSRRSRFDRGNTFDALESMSTTWNWLTLATGVKPSSSTDNA